MKHHKTVTDAVRAANRHNAESSTGAQTPEHGKSTSSRNALRHGIPSRKGLCSGNPRRAEWSSAGLFEQHKNYYRGGSRWRSFWWRTEITPAMEKLGISEG